MMKLESNLITLKLQTVTHTDPNNKSKYSWAAIELVLLLKSIMKRIIVAHLLFLLPDRHYSPF